MAINDISQYFTLDNGSQIANDSTFASLAANTRIKNKNTGSTFIKNSNYSNVFDRVSTFTEFIKATDFKIATSGSGNAVANISYTPSTRTVTQTLTTFATPAELTAASNNLKSQAVGSISVSGRTVTYKNINGQTLGSFQTQDNDTTYSAGTGLYLSGTQFNVTRSTGSSNLWWNTEVTLGTVAGLAIKAKLPANPNTNISYYAGDGLSLNGTTFSLALTSSHIINALGYTPANPVSGEDSSGNGWVRFKNGVQICGQICSSQVKDFAVNFPVAFTSVWSVTITNIGDSWDSRGDGKVDGVGTSGFAIHTSAPQSAWCWMAIGTWK